MFHYLQITGGNKHRGGFIYKLTDLKDIRSMQNSIEISINKTLEQIKTVQLPTEAKTVKEQPKIQQTKPNTEEIPTNTTLKPQRTILPERSRKRVRIEEGEEYTLKFILELEQQQKGREYRPNDLTILTKRSRISEARYLRTLWEQGVLNREWRKNQYYYTLAQQ